jgi:hypothetical protein
MATPWVDRVKQTGQLSVFPGPGVAGGGWVVVFDNALLRFNELSRLLSFRVRVTKATSPPDKSGRGGADIQFETASKHISFTALGQTESESFSGNGLHGLTKTVAMSFGGGPAKIEKAFIFVPSTPLTGGAKARVVGDGVKLVIAVHELIHACGLDEKGDHSPFTDPDLFLLVGSLSAGTSPQDDKLDFGGKIMPPIWMSRRTAAKIKALW